jgi:transcriptional regulator with XRE-family HTH domain
MNSIAEKVSAKSWSEASFSQMVGKHRRWLSEVRRDKNLPSPKEAAKMCVLLQVDPEDILLEQADIELVRGLLENEKAPGINAEGFVPTMKDWEEQAENWTDDQILQAMQKLVEIQQRRRSDGR